MRTRLWPWAFGLILLGSPQPAFAYLDPGTGSMLLQVILGGMAAVGIAANLVWRRIRIAFGKNKKSATEDEPA